jgi:hypothetical protein
MAREDAGNALRLVVLCSADRAPAKPPLAPSRAPLLRVPSLHIIGADAADGGEAALALFSTETRTVLRHRGRGQLPPSSDRHFAVLRDFFAAANRE